jgi:AcrR family transcriptional regulator
MLTFGEPFRELSRRQTEVLDTIQAVFLREGLRPVRIGQLAEEAHCSRSTLYELAPTKEELFLLVLDRLIRGVRQQGMDAIERNADPVERLRAGLSAGALGLSPLGPTFMEAVREYPPAMLLFESHSADVRTNLERLTQDAVDAGRFRQVDVRVVAEALLAIIDRLASPEFVRRTGIEPSRAIGEAFNLLIDGIQASGRRVEPVGRHG